MNVYIYDSYVNKKKYSSTIARVETRVTDLGLNGKIIRLGMMSNLRDSLDTEIKNGAKTIVIVGNSKLYNQAVNMVAGIIKNSSIDYRIPIGFIPVGKKDNEIADYLGISLEENACDTLSARRVEQVNLGLINDYYFLSKVVITTKNTTLEIDQNYSIEISKPGEIGVVNLSGQNKEVGDGSTAGNSLELYVKTKSSKKFLPMGAKTDKSIFAFKELRIINPKIPVIADESIEINTPATIKNSHQKISLIVGKGRRF